MIQAPAEQQPRIWYWWFAAALVAVGGVLPLVLGGTSSRVSAMVVPFAIAAAIFVACGFINTESRTVMSSVYFVGGLAVIYGLFSMLALSLNLTLIGTCPAGTEPCPSGLPSALSDGELAGMVSAAAFGVVGLLVGFFGLVKFYRRGEPQPIRPPERRIPPVGQALQAKAAVEPTPEAELELPAPEELAELPAHESSTAKS